MDTRLCGAYPHENGGMAPEMLSSYEPQNQIKHVVEVNVGSQFDK